MKQRILTLLVVLGLLSPALAYAKPKIKFGLPDNFQSQFVGSPIQIADQTRSLSFREVAQIINSQVPGEALKVEEGHENGRKVFVVLWKPAGNSGKYITFVVDAESGQILRRSGG